MLILTLTITTTTTTTTMIAIAIIMIIMIIIIKSTSAARRSGRPARAVVSLCAAASAPGPSCSRTNRYRRQTDRLDDTYINISRHIINDI